MAKVMTNINIKSGIVRIFQLREFFLVAMIIMGLIVMSLISPTFLSRGNLLSMLMGLTIQAIVAIGMTIVIISKGLDLSVGSVLAFSSMITAMSLKAGIPVLVSILIGLLSGALFGFVNGFIIAKVGVNPFITTLGTMIVIRGLVLLICKGIGISSLPQGFNVLGQAKLLGIQSLIWIMAALVIIFEILLRKHVFFRYNYYLGSNEKAALFSGFKVNKIKILDYMISGVLAALSGILMTARLGSFSTTSGTNLEMNVLAAVIIGGASLNGGEGSILGSFLGCLLIAFIGNALNLLGVSVYWQQMIMGLTLLFAVLLDVVTSRRKMSTRKKSIGAR